MLQKSKIETSRYTNLLLLLTKEEMERCLGRGMYAILGKVAENVFLSKQEAISFLLANKKETLGFSVNGKGLEKMQVDESLFLIKETKPVIYLKAFSFGVCSLGNILQDYNQKDAVSFGIKISYPLLFSEDGNVEKTRDHFEETDAFKKMRMFARKETLPIKLKMVEKIIATPFRVSKDAMDIAKNAVRKVEGLNIYGH